MPVPRATASHGLKARNTSPASALATGVATQNTTNTQVGRMLSRLSCAPNSPA